MCICFVVYSHTNSDTVQRMVSQCCSLFGVEPTATTSQAFLNVALLRSNGRPFLPRDCAFVQRSLPRRKSGQLGACAWGNFGYRQRTSVKHDGASVLPATKLWYCTYVCTIEIDHPRRSLLRQRGFLLHLSKGFAYCLSCNASCAAVAG